ncbi:enoyl-CoA hydratase/isomerase family protein [Rhodococcus sp. ARC_M5]|uniref:enoyl-CoA hydratase/isomerase family protein n=1 Tax=Rhodococcus sp. ARC_M5 TaxID=2928851 RepID=UPI0035B0927E
MEDTNFEGLAEIARDFSAFKVLYQENLPDRVHLMMDRPEVRNAMDETWVSEFHAVCDWLEQNPRTLIISGTTYEDPKSGSQKGVFAAGADLRQMRERRRDHALRGINSRLFHRIHELPMPVIAAMDGFALGGGAELAWACDFRIATHSLEIGQTEVGLGISAAAGAMWRLKELVGEPIALDMLFTGRILNADEALDLRLVTELHDPENLLVGAHALADRIASQDPLAVRITKRVYHMPKSAHPHVDDLAQAILFESEAKFERMQAFLDRKSRRTAQED